jgi:hypothetical protein
MAAQVMDKAQGLIQSGIAANSRRAWPGAKRRKAGQCSRYLPYRRSPPAMIKNKSIKTMVYD